MRFIQIFHFFPSYFCHFKEEFFDRRLELDTQFVFDLEVPKSFTPTNNDGEVNEFLLVPLSDLINKICDLEVSINSAPRLMDFLIRKGFLTFEKGMYLLNSLVNILMVYSKSKFL